MNDTAAETREHLRAMALSLATGTGPLVEPRAFDAALDTYRASVLREVAALLHQRASSIDALSSSDFGEEARAVRELAEAAETLRRMADETPAAEAAVDLPTLAAALDGIHTLIATSSRDWQTYRVDAWLWAVLCGWDCEQTEHDETCTHGALEETAAMHGWDAATVAKARRYRAAVRTLTEARQPAEADVEHCVHDRAVHTRHHHQPVTGCPWCATAETQQDEPDHVCNSVWARGEMDEVLGYLICGVCGTRKGEVQR